MEGVKAHRFSQRLSQRDRVVHRVPTDVVVEEHVGVHPPAAGAKEVTGDRVQRPRAVPSAVKTMTADMALQLGQAVAHVFQRTRSQHHRFIIGKDTRLSGYLFENAMAAGICSMGGDVLLVGPMPTPAMAFLTADMRCDAGVMISASHNPYQDNGIKFFSRDGFKLDDGIEQRIEDLIFSGALTPWLAYGIAATFVTTAIAAATVAARSSIPFMIAGPDGSTAAVTATLAAALTERLVASGASFAFLTDQLHWFPKHGALYWEDWSSEAYPLDFVQGTLVGRRARMPSYDPLRRGEDTALCRAIVAGGETVARVRDAGWSHVYTYHGDNAFPAPHHQAIASASGRATISLPRRRCRRSCCRCCRTIVSRRTLLKDSRATATSGGSLSRRSGGSESRRNKTFARRNP